MQDFRSTIQVNNRLAGKSTINYKTGLETPKEIVFIATVFAPYKFFSLLVSIILFFTLLWGVPFIISGKGFTAATAIGILTAVPLWSLGVMAQLISRSKKGFNFAKLMAGKYSNTNYFCVTAASKKHSSENFAGLGIH